MTPLDEIRSCSNVTITAVQAGAVLRCRPNAIRHAARTAPERLGFPVICIGSTVKIPRIPFLQYVTGGSCAEADTGASRSG